MTFFLVKTKYQPHPDVCLHSMATELFVATELFDVDWDFGLVAKEVQLISYPL